ncbi:MAG: FkbM family methyltransferase [Arenimonas sp.]
METQLITIDDININVINNPNDAKWYAQRQVFEEKASFLYKLLGSEQYLNFVDVGANYGFISLIAKRHNPNLNMLVIEADTRLCGLIEQNFTINAIKAPVIINAIAGAETIQDSSFSINPSGTLDNRVHMPAWEKISVPTVRVSDLIERYLPHGKTFIKIDTQGFEREVLKGLYPFLCSNNNWTIKMEFAPNWLKSQNTDPLELLTYLGREFEIAEMPARIRFNTPTIASLFDKKLSPIQFPAFLNYVTSLNRSSLGWVDLLVRPTSPSA